MKRILGLFLVCALVACGGRQTREDEDWGDEPSGGGSGTSGQKSSHSESESNEESQKPTKEQLEFQKARAAAMANLADDDADPCEGEDCPAQYAARPSAPEKPKISRAEQEAALQKFAESLRDDGPIADAEVDPKSSSSKLFSGESAQAPIDQEMLEALAIPSFALADSRERISQCLKLIDKMASSLEKLNDQLEQLTKFEGSSAQVQAECGSIALELNRWAEENGQMLLESDDEGVSIGFRESETVEHDVSQANWRYRLAMRKTSQYLLTMGCEDLKLAPQTVTTFQRIPADLNHWIQPRDQAEVLAVMGKELNAFRKFSAETVTASNCYRLGQILNDWAADGSREFFRLDIERKISGVNLTGDNMPQVTRTPATRMQTAYAEELTRLLRRVKSCKREAQFKQQIQSGFSELTLPESLSFEP